MIENKEIIEAIKKARKNKRLSQSKLGERIGVPQSHISKIEKGAVDIKLSSLVQIARVLDLEVRLLPKKALPAVESIVTGITQDQTAQALNKLRNAHKTIDQLQNTSKVPSDFRESIQRIDNTLKGLQALNYDLEAFSQLQKALSPISKITAPLKNIDTIVNFHKDIEKASKQLKEFDRFSKNLQNLRNNLAHRYEHKNIFARPAYTLDDNDE